MSSSRRTALIAGVYFVLTFVSAIVGAALYGPLLTDPDYVLGSGADAQVQWGAVCEVVLCITNIGTAIVLFPVLRRQNEAIALGYVASRIVEAALIAVGIVSVLSVVTLRQSAGSGDALVSVAAGLVAVHDWTFLLGPGFLSGFGNGILLGYLMYRSRLVPRGMALLGLVGGPLVCLSGFAVLFGFWEQSSVPSGLATLLEIAWEGSLGLYLIIKGFRPAPILAAQAAQAARHEEERTSAPELGR